MASYTHGFPRGPLSVVRRHRLMRADSGLLAKTAASRSSRLAANGRWATVAQTKLSHFDVGMQVRNNGFSEPD